MSPIVKYFTILLLFCWYVMSSSGGIEAQCPSKSNGNHLARPDFANLLPPALFIPSILQPCILSLIYLSIVWTYLMSLNRGRRAWTLEKSQWLFQWMPSRFALTLSLVVSGSMIAICFDSFVAMSNVDISLLLGD
jgi:hypothetical protein